jgi:hypothetical protein
MMKLDFAIAALMSSDIMFAAGSENCLFERIDVLRSGPAEFACQVDSDLPAFMSDVLQIKASDNIFNCEGVTIPFGTWKPEQTGLRGFVKSAATGRHLLVAVNNGETPTECRVPGRIRAAGTYRIHTPDGFKPLDHLPTGIGLDAGQLLIITTGAKTL